MSLWEQIDQELITALKSNDPKKRDTLRLIKSALKNAAIDSKKDLLDDEEVIKVITKEVKRRKESIEVYEQIGKTELAEEEKAELEILNAYLPEMMDEDGVKKVVLDYLEKNPTTPQEMGKAMGALSAELKGKADMGLVSKILRENVQ